MGLHKPRSYLIWIIAIPIILIGGSVVAAISFHQSLSQAEHTDDIGILRQEQLLAFLPTGATISRSAEEEPQQREQHITPRWEYRIINTYNLVIFWNHIAR
jgi:hypothetical protein